MSGVGGFLDTESWDPVESHCGFLGYDQVAVLMDEAASVTLRTDLLAPAGDQAGLALAPGRLLAWHGSMPAHSLLRMGMHLNMKKS